METWDGILLMNFILGLLACYYFAKAKGEILISDIIHMFFILLFGSIAVWSYIYDNYTKPLNTFFNNVKTIGKKPLWRSKGIIAREVLYGEKDD